MPGGASTGPCWPGCEVLRVVVGELGAEREERAGERGVELEEVAEELVQDAGDVERDVLADDVVLGVTCGEGLLFGGLVGPRETLCVVGRLRKS